MQYIFSHHSGQLTYRYSFVIFILLLVILSFSITGCQGSSESDVKIGALFALTGDGADWGQDEAEAVRLAIEEANRNGGVEGKTIDLLLEDGPAGNVDATVSAFRSLTDVEQAPVVIGPTWDDAAAAVAPIADQKQIPVVAPDASSGVESDEDYEFFFSVFAPEMSEMRRLADFLAKEGVKRVAAVYNLDPFSQTWRDAFAASIKEESELQLTQDFPISDQETRDFRTQITRLKKADVGAVYIEFVSQSVKGPFLRQAKELGLDAMFVSSSTSETQSLVSKYSSFVNGLRFASPKTTKRSEQLVKKFRERYGHEPRSPAAPYAYDAARMVIHVLRKGARTGPAIRDSLMKITDFNGVTASGISFDSTGRVVWPTESYTMKKIEDGEFVTLDKSGATAVIGQ